MLVGVDNIDKAQLDLSEQDLMDCAYDNEYGIMHKNVIFVDGNLFFAYIVKHSDAMEQQCQSINNG